MYQSSRFEIWHEFAPEQDIRYEVSEMPFPETAATAAMRRAFFRRRVEEVFATLDATQHTVGQLASTGLGQAETVLYRKEGDTDKKIAYDGKTYGFLGYDIRGTEVVVRLVRIWYSHVIASKYPEYTALRASDGLPMIPAGVGICCAAVSSDNMVLLTERSSATMAHPDLWHTMGGNIDVHRSAKETIMEEMTEELSLLPGVHFQPEDIRLVALGADPHYEEGDARRPEILFHAHLGISYDVMKDAFACKHNLEVDSVSIRPFALDDSFPERFADLVASETIIPSGEASLAYAWREYQLRSGTA